MDPKISVIVPIYKVEQYLRQCLDSIVNQTYKNLEIILVDDGSPDNCGAICEEYAARDERIVYIDQTNQGVSVARNNGLRHATGEWVSFVDGDDWVTTDMISTLLDVADESDIVVGDFFLVNADRITQSSFFQKNTDRDLRMTQLYLIGNALGCRAYGAGTFSNIGVPWGKIYRKEFLLRTDAKFPVGIRRMQDTLFNIGVFLENPKTSFSDRSIYYYRLTENSTCHRYDPQFDSVAIKIAHHVRDLLKDIPDEKIQELIIFKEAAQLQETISLHYCHSKCDLTWREKCAALKALCNNGEYKLREYPRRLCTWKQQLVLDTLMHHLYGLVVLMYQIKNRIENN